MVLRSLVFILIAFGVTFAIGFLGAAIIKLIAVVLNRKKAVPGSTGKQTGVL